TLLRTVANSSMSAPAANASLPAPRSTTHRRSSCPESAFMTRPSSAHMAAVNTFSFPGLLRTTVAAASVRSTCMLALIERAVFYLTTDGTHDHSRSHREHRHHLHVRSLRHGGGHAGRSYRRDHAVARRQGLERRALPARDLVAPHALRELDDRCPAG